MSLAQHAIASGNSSSPTVNYPTATTTGNLLVCFLAIDGAVTPTLSGWTLADSSTAAYTKLYAYYRASASSVSSVSPTLSGSARWSIQVDEYPITAGSPLDQTGVSFSFASSPAASPSLTTTQANETILFGFAGDDGSSTWSSPTNSFTLVDQATNATLSLAVVDRTVTSTGAHSTALTDSAGGHTNVVGVSFSTGGAVAFGVSPLTGSGTLATVVVSAEVVDTATVLTGAGTLPAISGVSTGYTLPGVGPFGFSGTLAVPGHTGPDGVSIDAYYLAAAGTLSDANYPETFVVISAGTLSGLGVLIDPAADGQPLAALGVLGVVSLHIPPSMVVGALALEATGVLASVVPGTGIGFTVSPLAGAGTIGNVAIAAAGSLSLTVSPLVGFGTLPATHVWLNGSSALVYSIYANDGAGGPIDYLTPIAVTQSLSWASSALTYPGEWKFGVRVSSLASGLEEKNLDASIRLLLNSSGADITNRPPAPVALRAFARANGSIRVEWAYPYPSLGSRRPTGFHVYLGSPTVSYASPVATIPFTGLPVHIADIVGLTDGTTYAIGVRAYNATAEESNTASVSVLADATGPTAVVGLTATASSAA